jgi:DNA-binding IclR family transcriptional regulator
MIDAGHSRSPHEQTGPLRDTSSALGRALSVLEMILASGGALGMPELCTRLDLPRQTAHRLVNQLIEQGLLQRNIDRDQFMVGPLLRTLALETMRQSQSNGPRHALLAHLAAQTGETCFLGILDQDKVMIIDRVETQHALRVHTDLGRRLDPHSSAIGKVLLAHLPKARRRGILEHGEPLMRYTPFTVTDIDALEVEFSEIRKRGYSVSNQGATLGMYSLGVPVRDGGGRVTAALSCHAPLVRLDEERGKTDILPLLRRGAQQLEDILRAEMKQASLRSRD